MDSRGDVARAGTGRFGSGCAQNLRGLIHVTRLHPKERPVPSNPGGYSADCGDIDLRLSQPRQDICESADPIISLDEKAGFRAD